MKTALIYYSLEGNTELIANMIKDKIDVDLIKLIPEKEIPKEGFMKYVWGGKSVLFKEKPQLMNKGINLDTYDRIIFGTPIWAGGFTPPLLSFLTENTIKDKKISLYACNKGGSSQKCFSNFKDHLKDNEIIQTMEFKEPKEADKNLLEDKLDKFISKINQ